MEIVAWSTMRSEQSRSLVLGSIVCRVQKVVDLPQVVATDTAPSDYNKPDERFSWKVKAVCGSLLRAGHAVLRLFHGPNI